MSASNLILGPIVGGLSERSANLWGRADGPGRLRFWLGRKDDLGDAQIAGTSLPLQAEDGWAGAVPVAGLAAETTYHYDLRLDARRPPVQKGYPKFTTFPRPGKERDFSFAFGSCFRPAEAGGGAIFTSLERHRLGLEKDPAGKLRFLLLLGDQVYADNWKFNGLWQSGQGRKRIALTLEDYRQVYRYVWSNPPFRAALKNLPAFMILDDHEVDDDWRWRDPERRRAAYSALSHFSRWIAGRPPAERRLTPERVRDALKACWEHQGMHAPLMSLSPKLDEEGEYVLERHDPGSLAYSFTCGAAAFFVMDTRTMRVRNPRERRLLGDGQWHLLKDWLLEVKDRYPVKFLVSSSSVLYSMWVDVLDDRWSGFRPERDTLLRFIGEQRIEGVYFITGDLHSGHAMSAECGSADAPVTIREFCSSPFEQACNQYARLMYSAIRTGAVHHPRRQFVVTEPNYGIVRVRYGEGSPQVDFELYGTDGQLLAPR